MIDKISKIEVSWKENSQVVYEQARKIWSIPPLEMVEKAIKEGDLSPIREWTDGWVQPFQGPDVALEHHVRNGRAWTLLRITTDTSEREIIFSDDGSMIVNFGENGSIFAAGDLIARAKIALGRVGVDDEDLHRRMKVILTSGVWTMPEWPPRVGMARAWRAAQAFESGEMDDESFWEFLDNFEEDLSDVIWKELNQE
jgi:hypothetical protein